MHSRRLTLPPQEFLPKAWQRTLRAHLPQQPPLWSDKEEPCLFAHSTVTTADVSSRDYMVSTAIDMLALYAVRWQVSRAQAGSRMVAESHELMEMISAGEEDAAAGRTVSWEDVFGED